MPRDVVLQPTPSPRHPTALAFGIAALLFAAIAPTLTWLEFSSGSENLVVETVLEMRRGGPWLVPTLEGQLRTQKPPLTAWITAAVVRPGTVAALWDVDPAHRDAAYRRLAWETRWTALAASCATLLAVYALGRTLADARLGLVAALVAGTTVIFLRFGRYATTDVWLALWVTSANALLARAVLKRHAWSGFLFAGAALGLAFMTKGPVALAQTIVPMVAFVVWRRWKNEGGNVFFKGSLLPSLLGLLIMLAIGLPWYLHILMRHSGVGSLWIEEVTRSGVPGETRDRIYSYAILIPLMLPWSVFFIAGIMGASVEAIRGGRDDDRDRPASNGIASSDGIVLALLLVLLPVIVMTAASTDRKDRYLLPLLGPAAVLTAWGMRQVRHTADRAGATAIGLHWLLLAGIAIALPVLGAGAGNVLRARDGGPWFGWPLATGCAAVFVLIVATGIALQRRWRGTPRAGAALVGATVATMLGLAPLAVYGYGRSAQGLSEMKPMADAIWATQPDAIPYYHHRGRSPNDLAIYLDRMVRQIKDPSALTPADRPQLLILHQRKGNPAPTPPPGWTFVTQIPRDQDRLHAFVLPPKP